MWAIYCMDLSTDWVRVVFSHGDQGWTLGAGIPIERLRAHDALLSLAGDVKFDHLAQVVSASFIL